MLPLALLLALSAPDPLASTFVIADVVKLRSAPRADAEVLARLRINTALTLVDDAGGSTWRHVALPGRPDVVGYVARELLGERRLELADVERRAAEAAAGTAQERAAWQARLRALREDSGGRIWLAWCNGERAVLLAVDEGARVRPLAGDEPVAGLAEALSVVSALPWYSGNAQLEGTPFPTPFAGPLWNDATGALPPAPGSAVSSIEGQPAPLPIERAGKLVLGPCTRAQHGLLATQPSFRPGNAGIVAADALRRSAALVERWRTGAAAAAPAPADAHAFAGAVPGTATLRRAEVLRLFDGSVVMLSASVHARWQAHHGDEDGVRSLFVLEDDDGRSLSAPKSWAGEGATELRWTRGEGRLLVLPTKAQDEGEGSGVLLVRPRGARVEVVEVITDRAGC